jgi:hypothetical protein
MIGPHNFGMYESAYVGLIAPAGYDQTEGCVRLRESGR